MDLAASFNNVEPRLVAPLQQFGRADIERVGGKGANLGELIRAGFPVPAGFAITTAAYDYFVASNHLGESITALLSQGENRGLAIRAAFENGAIPPEVERDILAACQRLRPGAVAVRSSATAEDLPEAAFAGQQDSYLNVAGAEALLNAGGAAGPRYGATGRLSTGSA
jgi:pyruvate,water dikinase